MKFNRKIVQLCSGSGIFRYGSCKRLQAVLTKVSESVLERLHKLRGLRLKALLSGSRLLAQLRVRAKLGAVMFQVFIHANTCCTRAGTAIGEHTYASAIMAVEIAQYSEPVLEPMNPPPDDQLLFFS